jgi:hypothetical protein
MTNEHPITPPPGLRQLWAQQAQRMNPRDPIAWQEHIADQAARWGADQELKACCEWLAVESIEASQDLRAARRPKPPSLKEQALAALQEAAYMADDSPPQGICSDQIDTIRRALEALDD